MWQPRPRKTETGTAISPFSAAIIILVSAAYIFCFSRSHFRQKLPLFRDLFVLEWAVGIFIFQRLPATPQLVPVYGSMALIYGPRLGVCFFNLEQNVKTEQKIK